MSSGLLDEVSLNIKSLVSPATGMITIRTQIDNNVTTEIINSQEKLVREALISLGWTPPKEEGDER